MHNIGGMALPRAPSMAARPSLDPLSMYWIVELLSMQILATESTTAFRIFRLFHSKYTSVARFTPAHTVNLSRHELLSDGANIPIVQWPRSAIG
jgi:hypothetical protein